MFWSFGRFAEQVGNWRSFKFFSFECTNLKIANSVGPSYQDMAHTQAQVKRTEAREVIVPSPFIWSIFGSQFMIFDNVVTLYIKIYLKY